MSNPMKRVGDGSISPEKLIALMAATLEAQAAAKEITDVVAGDVADAALTHGLHQRAFSLCRGIAKLDQVKRLALLDAFDSYRHILNLDAAPQLELVKTELRAAG